MISFPSRSVAAPLARQPMRMPWTRATASTGTAQWAKGRDLSGERSGSKPFFFFFNGVFPVFSCCFTFVFVFISQFFTVCLLFVHFCFRCFHSCFYYVRWCLVFLFNGL